MKKYNLIRKIETILLIIGMKLWFFFCCQKIDPCPKKFHRLVYALKLNIDSFLRLPCHLTIPENYRFVLKVYYMGCGFFFDKASLSKKCQNDCFSEKFWPKSGQLPKCVHFLVLFCTKYIMINLFVIRITRNYWNSIYFNNWSWNHNLTLMVLLVLYCPNLFCMYGLDNNEKI